MSFFIFVKTHSKLNRMKDFFKYTLATITGFIIVNIIGIFLLFIVIGAIAATSSEPETIVTKESVFVLNLKGQIKERAKSSTLLEIFNEDGATLSLDDIVTSIKKAKFHDKINAIHINMGSFGAGMGAVEEIRDALLDFKSSGKKITTYGDQYSQGAYYLASVADQIYINPQGNIFWTGLAAQPMFYTNLMKKVGVDMQIFKVGTYKSAVEPYTQEKMSEASKEQVSVFLTDIWDHIVDNVSIDRNISVDRLNQLADQMIAFKNGTYYLEQGLVDSIIYKNDLDDLIRVKDKNDKKATLLSLKNMTNLHMKAHKEAQTLAVYYASGAIIDGGGNINDEVISANKVIKDLKKLEKDDKIKGVVIRVNSPGGSAFASEQIWKSIIDLKAVKPVVISMGDYAASGGYYISSAADYIVAEPTTLTGSIGIFAMIPNFEKLTEKVGLSFDVVKTNEHADFGALGRALNEKEQALLQNYINSGYELFIKRCADGRQMTSEEIKKIAEGRVWTGKRALELGLVDELGGLEVALNKLKEKAGLEIMRVKKYPAPSDLLTELLNLSIKDAVQSAVLGNDVLQIVNETKNIKLLSKESILQARIPYTVNIQ